MSSLPCKLIGFLLLFVLFLSNNAKAVTNNEKFIRRLYQDILGREADPSGLSFWINKMAAPANFTPARVATSFFSSHERHELDVKRYYDRFLGRAATANEIQSSTSLLDNGTRQEVVMSNIMGSIEYFARVGANNQALVFAVYLDQFGRTPNSGELSAGLSRIQISGRVAFAYETINRAEARVAQVSLWYIQHLGRVAEPGGAEGWAALFAVPTPGQTREMVEGGIAGSAEAYARYTSENFCTPTINNEKQLLIRKLSVVEDAKRINFNPSRLDLGHWSFGYLMTKLTPAGMTPNAFVLQWLNKWSTNQFINGFMAPKRASGVAALIAQWPKRADGSLDLAQSPLRLLGIVNRMDLRSNATNAGEGRFVFGVLNAAGFPTSFTIIFEYTLPITAQMTLNRWALEWGRMDSFQDGEAFNVRLQELTDIFTQANPRLGIFQTPLHQLRTNELSLGNPWELREFNALSTGLEQVTVKQTPDSSFNGPIQTTLKNWVLQNQSAILAGTHVIPNSFLGAASPNFPSPWLSSAGLPENLRKAFSTNTCNGCHSFETNSGFTHLNERTAGQISAISPFLVNDLAARNQGLKNQLILNYCQP